MRWCWRSTRRARTSSSTPTTAGPSSASPSNVSRTGTRQHPDDAGGLAAQPRVGTARQPTSRPSRSGGRLAEVGSRLLVLLQLAAQLVELPGELLELFLDLGRPVPGLRRRLVG